MYEKFQRNKHIKLDPSYYVWIELLLILQEINAPLNSFEKIMRWATKSKSNGYQFTNSYPSRKLLLKQLEEMTCGDKGKNQFQRELYFQTRMSVKSQPLILNKCVFPF